MLSLPLQGCNILSCVASRTGKSHCLWFGSERQLSGCIINWGRLEVCWTWCCYSTQALPTKRHGLVHPSSQGLCRSMKRKHCGDNSNDGVKETVSFLALPLKIHDEGGLAKDSQKAATWIISMAFVGELEKRTRSQSSNDDWQCLHSYVMTSSNFKKIVSCKQGIDSILSSLIKRLDHIMPVISHGKTYEGLPRDAGIHQGEGYQRKKCAWQRVWNRSSPTVSFPWRIARWSSLWKYDTVVWLLEIKCPYATFCQALTIEQASAKPDFFCELVNGSPSLRCSHAYFFQAQGQMAIWRSCWLVWVFFVFLQV